MKKILVILDCFTIGGTERAACTWALGLVALGHRVYLIVPRTGPLEATLAGTGIVVKYSDNKIELVERYIREISPDLIHEHVPGMWRPKNFAYLARKQAGYNGPLLHTNVFGRLDHSLFAGEKVMNAYVSSTSCVQSFIRSRVKMEESCFEQNAIVPNPVIPMPVVSEEARAKQRREWFGETSDNLFIVGRIGRPDKSKWTTLHVDMVKDAAVHLPQVRFVFREMPSEFAAILKEAGCGHLCRFLSLTSSRDEMALTLASCDAVAHFSRIGESFGYSIAEPMTMGIPIIVCSSPDFDQAQLEWIRNGEDGFQASSPRTVREALEKMVGDRAMTRKMGQRAKEIIFAEAGSEMSTASYVQLVQSMLAGGGNPNRHRDFLLANKALANLKASQWSDVGLGKLKLIYLSLRGFARNWYHHGKVHN